MPHATLISALGALTLIEREGALVALAWRRASAGTPTPLLNQAIEQLEAYFDGRLRAFSLPLAAAGSTFQKSVWSRLRAIPYGEVETYGALARDLGTAPRALAQACATNPLPIIVPCHRVVAAAGRLGGYSGGAGPHTKEALLRLEGAGVRFAGERDARAASID